MKLAPTLTQYRDGDLEAIRYGISNGPPKSLNGRISVLKHRAFSLRSAHALIAMIFLARKRLPIRPAT